MSKKSKKGSIENYRDIPLQEGELARIIISQKEDGSITTLTKGSGRAMTFVEAIGLLEIAKSEALIDAKGPKNVPLDPALLEPVEIILDDIDVALDVDGIIEREGLKIDGKPIIVSLYAATQREKRRKEYLDFQNNK